MSEKTYTFIFPDGDAVERPFRCTQDAIDCAKEEFDGVERVIIGREITEYHDIGTVENGVFTPAGRDRMTEDELIAAINRLADCLPESPDEYPDASMARQVFDAIKHAASVVAKAKGGAK